MARYSHFLLTALLLLLLATGLLGCTAIGFVVGSLADHASPRLTPKDSLSYREIEEDGVSGHAKVITRDGMIHQGGLEGLVETPDSLFSREVRGWCEAFPHSPYHALLARSVSLDERGPSNPIRGAIVRVDPEKISVQEGGKRGDVHTIAMRWVRTLRDASGRLIDLDSLETALEQKELPCSRSLLLRTDGGDHIRIPWQSVESVSAGVPDPPVRGRIIGTVVGVALDVAAVVLMSNLRGLGSYGLGNGKW